MRRIRGFTLIEVLVALVVMSTMAMMAWRGLDALIKSREIAQTNLDQSARLQTVLAQWEQDLRQIQDSGSVEALNFDGASLRLTRQHRQGIQVVVWAVRGGALNRWESKPVQTVGALEENFKHGAQLLAQDSGQLRALEGVSGWQLYCYRGNSWSNCLSSGSEEVAAPPSPPASPASGAAPPDKPRQSLPSGIRMLLQFGPGSGFAGPLTRQVELRPQS
jgi:general secretion pathway protein J